MSKFKSSISFAGFDRFGLSDNISNSDLRRLAKKLRLIARKAIPDAQEEIKMGMPCYSINKKRIALIADYTKHVNLYFPAGARLSSDLLKGNGEAMRHIRISEDNDLRVGEILKLLKQAAKNASSVPV